MPDLRTKRLFVAVELPDFLKKILKTYQDELKKSGVDAKWVEPQNIHLTLKFLGSVETEKIESLAQTLSGRFIAERRFDVTLNQLGCFPSLRAPRVVWAGLEDKLDALRRIAALTDETLATLGLGQETREFQSHVTLARIRSPRNRIDLLERINLANERFQPETFAIDNMTLFESRLSPKGPVYLIAHQIKFL